MRIFAVPIVRNNFWTASESTWSLCLNPDRIQARNHCIGLAEPPVSVVRWIPTCQRLETTAGSIVDFQEGYGGRGRDKSGAKLQYAF